MPCPFCKDTFPVIGGRSSSHRLRHHLTTVHAKLSEMREFKELMEEQLETVICTHCGKSYSNQATLNSHVKLMHSEQAELEACHICGKRFKKGGSTLWGHIRCYSIFVYAFRGTVQKKVCLVVFFYQFLKTIPDFFLKSLKKTLFVMSSCF